MSSWFHSWRFWRNAGVVLAVAALIGWCGQFLLLRWLGRDRDYAFPTARLSDPETVRMTVGMVGELKRVRAATESSLQTGTMDVFWRFVQLPSNRHAASWASLLRSPDADAMSPSQEDDLRGRLALVNSLVLQLDAAPGAPLPAELSALPAEEAIARLRRFFAANLESERIRLWESILERGPWQGLIRRQRWPSWPAPDRSPWTCWARRWLGRSDLRLAWVEGLARDLAPIEDLGRWYDELEKIERLGLPRSTATGLFLRRPRGTGGSDRAVRAAAPNVARMDFEVWYEFPAQAPPPAPLSSSPSGPVADAAGSSSPGSSSPGSSLAAPASPAGVDSALASGSKGLDSDALEQRSMDTGLRLVDVLLERTAASGGDPVPVLDEETNVVVEAERLDQLLRALGGPESLAAVDIIPSRRWTEGSRGFSVDFGWRHRLLGEMSHRATFPMNVADQPPLGDVVRRLAAEGLAKLDEELPRRTHFEGWQVAIEPSGDLGVFRMRLECAGVGPMSGILTRTEQGFLVWSDASNLAQRQRLIELLSSRSAALGSLASCITLEALRFDLSPPARLRGRLSIRLRDLFPGVADITGIPWALDANGEGAVELPPGFDIEKLQALALAATQRKQRADDAAQTASGSAALAWTADDIAKAVREELRASFSKIADSVESPLPTAGPDGFMQTLGLKLADWPMLTLGPQPIRTPPDAAAAVRKLLSERNVIEQSKLQWKDQGTHPSRGPVRAELAAWSPAEGIARLLCSLPIHGDLAAKWSEDLEAQVGGLWQVPNEEQVQERAAEFIDQAEDYVQQLALTELGLDLEAGVDRNGFGPYRWLRFNPPGIAFRGSLRPFAAVPLRIGVNKVRLGANGVTLAESEGLIEYPKTIVVPTPAGIPAIALSDPRLEFDFARKALLAGVKCTPPLPPGLNSLVEHSMPVRGTSPEAQEQMAALGMNSDYLPSSWRLDNPWINLAYVDSAAGFGFRDSAARGKGGVKLLNKHDAAHGDVSLYVKHLGVEGRVQGRKIPYVPLPTVNGQVSVNKEGHGGFDMNSEFELAGVKSHLKVSYPRSDVPESQRLLRTQGSAKVPVLGYVRLSGVTDPGFRDPYLQARGKIEMLGQPVNYVLSVNRQGFNVDWAWTTPDGRKLTYRSQGATLDESAGERMAQGLADAIRKGRNHGRGLSENEAAVVRQLPDSTTPPPSWSDPDTVEAPGSDRRPERKMFAAPGRPPVTETDIIPEVRGNRIVITRKSTKKLLVDLPLVDLELATLTAQQIQSGVKFTVWDPDSSGDAADRLQAVLAVDYHNNRLLLRRLSDARTVAGPADTLASELAALSPLFPDQSVADADRRALAHRQAMITCAALKLDQLAIVPARYIEGKPAVWLEWSEPTGERADRESTGESRRTRTGMLIDTRTVGPEKKLQIERTFCYDWLAPPEQWPAAAAHLASLSTSAPDTATALLLVSGSAQATRVARLWQAPVQPAANQPTANQPTANQPAADQGHVSDSQPPAKAYCVAAVDSAPGRAPLKIEISPEFDLVTRLSVEPRRSIVRLRELVRAAWNRGMTLEEADAFAGPEGIVAVIGGTERPGWWLSAARAADQLAEGAANGSPSGSSESGRSAERSEPAAVFLDRSVFVAWNHAESLLLLPSRWQTADARNAVDDRDFARQLVRPWPVHRELWGAHPMTLMTRLAK